MIEYFVLFYWALGLLHTHAEGDFLLNDEGSPNTFLGPPTPSDDLNGLWSTQDLSADNSPFTELSGEDSTACSGGASGFFGGKRIRSNACPGDQNGDIDPELEEIIKRLGGDGWDDGVSAADDDGGTQRAKMCPDVLHIEHVLPVCSSGSPSDMSFTPTGEIKLNWCTLVTQYYYLECYKPRDLYCCRSFYPMYPVFPDSVMNAGFTAEGCRPTTHSFLDP